MDTATSFARIGAGHEAHPSGRRRDAKGSLENRERVGYALEVRFADAGIVVQVVAEVGVAVAHIVYAVEHVGMPDLVNVRRGRDLLFRERLAELQETQVFVLRGREAFGGPVGIVALYARCHPTQVDSRYCCQGTCAHGSSIC